MRRSPGVTPSPEPQAAGDAAVALGMIGLVVAGLVVTVGTFWAFERAAPDFKVFYAAWRLVLEGHGSEVYREGPDRYLYAPGFAWLLSPLAWLPPEGALAVWCFAKAAVVGFVVREFQPARQGLSRLAAMGVGAWGVALLARPLLIDFQYGQVNTLILGACCWALLTHFRGRAGAGAFLSWALLAVAAVTKVFPLPLLAVPWFAARGADPRKLALERGGLAAGVALMFGVPALGVGPAGVWRLAQGWREALLARGLPFESHNQSFAALIHRWFSGEPVHVVALGMHPVRIGWMLLSEPTLRLLSLSWIAMAVGAWLAWLMRAERTRPLCWSAVAIALLVLPSHLVWKPYFTLFLPAGVLLAGASFGRSARGWAALAVAFAGMNLAGFDLLGGRWGALAESASLMLWAALLYLGLLAGAGGAMASYGPPDFEHGVRKAVERA